MRASAHEARDLGLDLPIERGARAFDVRPISQEMVL